MVYRMCFLYCAIVVIFQLFIFTSFVNGSPLPSDLDSESEDEVIVDLSSLGSTIYGYPNEESGANVEHWFTSNSSGNAEEQGTYFEGDILIPTYFRNAHASEARLWPKGVVPVRLDPLLTRDDVAIIKKAMREYHTHTCIRFVEWTLTDKDYVAVRNLRSGCFSAVGRVGGRQELNLQSGGCTTKIGTVLHEFMHALGFFHEHSRPDRDSNVLIHWENVSEGLKDNFNKQNGTSTLGIGYDYGSIQHYSSKAFSKNSKNTISAKDQGQEAKMGQREAFSEMDLKKINALYKCGNKGKNSGSLDWLG